MCAFINHSLGGEKLSDNGNNGVYIQVHEKEPFEGKATQKQKQLLWELGVRDEDKIKGLGKKQARIAITQLLRENRAYRAKKNSETLFTVGLGLLGISILTLVMCGVFKLDIQNDVIAFVLVFGFFWRIRCYIIWYCKANIW
jgi:hypothetical protein